MPMYNASSYLRECIDSVLEQTFTDFELLIADDGSTDDSVAIVKSYADPRIRLICRQHDYIATLNCLIDEARGKYIARMDADDVMMPSRLQRQVAYMDAHPEVDVLGCDTLSFEDTPSDSTEITPVVRTITIRDLVESNQINHPTAVLRSETVQTLGLRYNPDYIYAEDYKLWSDFARLGCKIVGLGIPVIFYRSHSSQISNIEASKQLLSQQAVKRENRLYAVNEANKGYVAPAIGSSDNKLTVIIPFLNEGEEVINTVASVREFAKNSVDIMVINDCSYDGIDYGKKLADYDVYYFVNFENKGVAASRDFGVSMCKTPYFLLLDAHMRFYESECFITICRLLAQNDRRLLCCQSTAIDPDDNGVLVPRAGYKIAFGAYSPYDMFSLWPDIKWNNYEKFPDDDIEPIDLVLGAGYAASKRYWVYLKGLYGLRGYGFDEAYISTKVWMEGGECLLLKKHILGHLYREASPYLTSNFNMIYNSLMISSLLLSRSCRNWSFAIALNKEHEKSTRAIALIRNDKELSAVNSYYKTILAVPYETIVTRNLQSQAQLYKDLTDKLTNVTNNYFQWLTSNHNNLAVGLRNGGLSSVLLYLSLYNRYSDSAADISIDENINRIEQSLVNDEVDFSFDEGLSGIGWLLIGMHRYGIISEIPSRIISAIDSRLESINLETVELKDFDKGLGSLLCYGCARLYAIDYLDDNTRFVTSQTLMTLRDLALKALSTPQCDSRTYYHALEFLDAISLENDEYQWTPELRDTVLCSAMPNLEMNKGGYDLFSGVMRNWAFALIHKFKTNQL